MWIWCINGNAKALALIAFGLGPIPCIAATQMDISSHTGIHVESNDDGFVANADGETLRVSVCRDNVVHVVVTSGGPDAKGASALEPWMLSNASACPGARFEFTRDADGVSIMTSQLHVKFRNGNDNLVYSTADDKELLRERPAVPRTFESLELNGVKSVTVEDRFMLDITEGIYGLGQHQNGMFNYRGVTLELGQDNMDVAIPLMVSSKGYGLLWNTASLTYVDDRYPPALSFRSLSADSIDYYFIYGPDMDNIIHAYRGMTGHTPLFPRWAYGFIQSKDSYRSQAEVLDVANKYRAMHIPLDCIVQDGGWWKSEGDLSFNSGYPEVEAELNELHREHVHAMISVWGQYDRDSVNLQKLRQGGLVIPGTVEYDATNPVSRDFFWKSLPGPLLAQGWDAFWLDASEPDSGPHEGDAMLLNKTLAIGSGDMYTNVFPLLHTGGIAEHWKQSTQGKRVMLLTRSAFLGQQRYGTVVWSGDAYPTNWAFHHQITAGLNFALSGLSYWTTDVAGYWALSNDPSMTSSEYQELYARWFQFGAFCPMFRTHGHRPNNEIWTFSEVTPILLTYDRLRYRLLPYIYSLAWKVTNDDYTMQRPLLMDWRTDPKVWEIGDEYMFGPALLVSPVWQQGARTRAVYLPDAEAWYDFWTGNTVHGKQLLEVDAPLQILPIFVPAGSILPLGPEIEYADQNSDAPMEVRIYGGADGSFTLYEDEGDGYQYEEGAHALIPMRWNDARKTLTIGDREGSFPGMAKNREFRIVLVGPGRGVGETVSSHANVVDYSGKAKEVTFAPK
jgi:alpha-D-xyloside xylohydrolase